MEKKKEIVIELKDLNKSYWLGKNRIDVLKNINLKVEKGEFLAILGKSGSGKTTLVNQIGCLDVPTSGKVILDGHNVSNLSESKLAKVRGKKIGFVFQKFNLIKSLSAVENIEIPMIFQGIPKFERKKRAEELLTLFDMKERFNNKPNELSGGQQQRIAIARALANKPQIILADEPTGNLDTKNGLIVIDYLNDLHKKGNTIILVTHNENLTKYAQRVIKLSDGKIIDEKINKKKNEIKNTK